jgi:hypothetical protein
VTARAVWQAGGMLDDSARRQLRFSLFLQGFAVLMMTTALVVRVTAIGWDGVTALLALAVVAILAAGGYTLRRLRAG